jgi:hypothetical protein
MKPRKTEFHRAVFMFLLAFTILTLNLPSQILLVSATETPTFGWQTSISHTNNWIKVNFTNMVSLYYCKSDLSDVDVGTATYVYQIGNILWIYDTNDPSTLRFGNYYNTETWAEPSTSDIITWADDFSSWTFGGGAFENSTFGNPSPSIELPVNGYAENTTSFITLKGTLSWDMYGEGGSGQVDVYIDDVKIATVTSTADTWESKSLAYTSYDELKEFSKIKFVASGSTKTFIDNIKINGVQVSAYDEVTLTTSNISQLNPFYICKFFDETGNAWTDYLTYTLKFISPLTNSIDNAVIMFGLSSQPSRITMQIIKDTHTTERSLPVTSNLETLEFYLENPELQSQYSIFIEELGEEVFNGGELWVYMRVSGVTKLLTVSDFTEQNGRMCYITVTPDVYYLLYVKKGSESFAAGSWYAGSSFSYTITIVVIPLQPSGMFKSVSWSVGRGDNGEVLAQGRFTSPYDCTVKVYYHGGTLMDQMNYSDVTIFNYVWDGAEPSESYTVVLEVPSLGFREAKVTGAGFDPNHPGYRLWLPLLGSMNPQIFSSAIVFAFMLTVTSRYKGIGTLLCVALIALFTYFGWLSVPLSLVYVLFWRKEGEAYEG